MGDSFQVIADLDATPDEAPRLAAGLLTWLVAEGVVGAGRTDCVLGAPLGNPPGPRYDSAVTTPDARLRTMWTNGVEVFAGATVVDGGQGADDDPRCPRCGTGDPQWDAVQAAIGAWHAGRPDGVACAGCGRTTPVADWVPWAFARVGVRFWNWPPLRPEFVHATAGRLGGHRVRVVDGKL